ncbi:hypothetical protein F5Y15DRAFT_145784 [Xylariaceae sp. FL0016]|nr:hypothetical protein F5Y15DRAFT_145784 [Xylariaceae sp. FL0016]
MEFFARLPVRAARSRVLRVGTASVTQRSTSWIAFEQPDPSLYAAPAPTPPAAKAPKTTSNTQGNRQIGDSATAPATPSILASNTQHISVSGEVARSNIAPSGSTRMRTTCAQLSPSGSISHSYTQKRFIKSAGSQNQETAAPYLLPTTRIEIPGEPATFGVSKHASAGFSRLPNQREARRSYFGANGKNFEDGDKHEIEQSRADAHVPSAIKLTEHDDDLDGVVAASLRASEFIGSTAQLGNNQTPKPSTKSSDKVTTSTTRTKVQEALQDVQIGLSKLNSLFPSTSHTGSFTIPISFRNSGPGPDAGLYIVQDIDILETAIQRHIQIEWDLEKQAREIRCLQKQVRAVRKQGEMRKYTDAELKRLAEFDSGSI